MFTSHGSFCVFSQDPPPFPPTKGNGCCCGWYRDTNVSNKVAKSIFNLFKEQRTCILNNKLNLTIRKHRSDSN